MKNKASIKNKIYRKLHWIIHDLIKPGKWINNLYPAYLHGKKYAAKYGKTINEQVNEQVKEQTKDQANNQANKILYETATDSLYFTEMPNEGAGIGHQLSNHNAGYHYSQLFNTKFAYYPFKNQQWDSFLGFGENEVTVKELKKQGYKVHTIPYFDEKKDYEMVRNIVNSYRGQKVILKTELDQFYQEQYGIIPHIKEKFENAKARKDDKLIYNKDETNIAIHIRRGDLLTENIKGGTSISMRWLNLDYYEMAVQYILNNIKIDKPVHFYIFSQGSSDEYKLFEKYGKITYCLDMPAKESFLHMVRADILVISKSSFSYKPALLSDGIRICPEAFWHGYPDNEKWIVLKEK